jgi:hypothetical protein
MKRIIDLDQIRVVQAANYKGNPRVYLEIMDQRVLYTEPGNLPDHYLSEDGETVDTDALADLFRGLIGRFFGQLLLEQYPDLIREMSWSPSTDREIGYTKPRLEEDPDA